MAPNQNTTLTPREMEVLALAWQCMETQPKIDINKLAALTGYTTGSASVTFGKIKQKIRLLADSVTNGASTTAPPSTPRRKSQPATPTSTARKRKNAATAANAFAGTPSKKAKKEGEKEHVSGEEDDEELLGDTVVVKKEEDMEQDEDMFGGDADLVFLD